jgi:hypothetical protein
MKPAILALVRFLASPLTAHRENPVFCRFCGKEIPAPAFRCKHCKGWVRPVFPQLMTLVLFFLGVILVPLYVWQIAPTLADVTAKHGAEIPLSMRALLGFHAFAKKLYFLMLIPAVWLFLCLGFFWRPQKSTGPHILLFLAVLYTLAIQTVFLMSLYLAVRFD